MHSLAQSVHRPQLCMPTLIRSPATRARGSHLLVTQREGRAPADAAGPLSREELDGCTAIERSRYGLSKNLPSNASLSLGRASRRTWSRRRITASKPTAGRLAGRKALITGGDSGMGRAAAIAYAREGADVALDYYRGAGRRGGGGTYQVREANGPGDSRRPS